MRMSERFVAVAILSLCRGSALSSQIIRGVVVLPDSSTPVAGAVVVATTERGPSSVRALSGAKGEFTLRLPAPGRYDLKVLRIGYRPTQGPSVTVADGATEAVRIVFAAEAVVLSAMNVRERETCRVNADSGFMVARVWEEARKAMLTSQLSADGATLFAEWIEYDRHLDSAARVVRQQHVRTSRNPTTHAFRSRSPEVLDTAGYVVVDSGATNFFVPDAEVLLSPLFAAGHCFQLENAPDGQASLIGVRFQPTRARRDMREIEGTLWVDRRSAELRSLDFTYTNLSDVAQTAHPGGRVEFLRLADGNWLVTRWSVRMPQLAAAPRVSNDGLRRSVMGRTPIVVRAVQVAGGEVTRVTRGDSLLYTGTGPHIDVQAVSADTSLAVAGATVSLEGTDYVGRADAAGRIRMAPVLGGRYRARISTPLMDSLGVPAVAQEVEAREDAHVDTLKLPRPRDILARVCPRDSIDHGEGMLRGTVRNGQAAAIKQAAVVVTWQTNVSIIGSANADHLNYTEKTIGTYTDNDGRWELCGVPQQVLLTVSVQSDSGSDAQRTRLAGDFGAVDLVARRDGAALNKDGARSRALVEFAVFNLQGAAVPDASLEVQPPSGPRRTVITGPTGRALIPDVAPGVITIRTRRIGFKPGQVSATVEPGRNTVPIMLSELSTPTLDTVRVVGGRRVTTRLDEFDTRHRSGVATASITREDIVKRNPVDAWQMLTNVPSIRIIGRDNGVTAQSTRSGHLLPDLTIEPCFLIVMVDGLILNGNPGQKAFDLRQLPKPDEIHGIEVFAGAASIPLQYGGVGDGKWCGMIAIWTR